MAFERSGRAPADIDIALLYDAFASNPAMILEEAGFVKPGGAGDFYRDGRADPGGDLPVNTDGGLIANGEPIGASGLRQVHELVRQLRGEAGDRQIPGSPRVGLAQVYGAPGTASATILSL